MYLSHLSLLNYRNFEELELDFSDKINCFIGNNGVGKTNILDSIYFLSFCKSWLNPIDIQNIKYNQDFFLIKGIYTMNESTETISCGIARGKKKSFKRNTKEYDRLSDHIGLIPLLTVSPYDSGLILGNSDERRKFMDIIISQFDKDYLQKLMKYNKVLQHRNQLLKQNPANVSFDRQIIEIWDEQLIFLGQQIYNKRMDYVKKIIPIFQDYYSGISAGKEQVGLEYKSQLSETDYRKALAENLERDRLLQYTSIGIHKDDLLFTLHNSPLKKHASQGQQKTYLIALKLAQFDLILSIDKVKPILLFDDIFDKLDAERVRQIIHLLADHHFGQIFISDTNKDRLDNILKQIGISYKLFILNGNIEETEVFLSS
jgi:DNA replication and repair protein RecF